MSESEADALAQIYSDWSRGDYQRTQESGNLWQSKISAMSPPSLRRR
jgi:hypothetical protein